MQDTTTETHFKHIGSPRISLEIVKQIQGAIFGGSYAPGMRLPSEREMVQTFGVSKVTVREALRILETYGLVEIRPGAAGGAFVKAMTPRPVSQATYNMLQIEGFRAHELYAARVLFEPPMTEIACQLATDEDLQELENTIARGTKLVNEGQQTSPESLGFHSKIIRIAGNRVIEIILTSLLDLVNLSQSFVPSTPEIMKMVLEDHEAILETMRQRNPVWARALMVDHLNKLAREFAKIEAEGIKLRGVEHIL